MSLSCLLLSQPILNLHWNWGACPVSNMGMWMLVIDNTAAAQMGPPKEVEQIKAVHSCTRLPGFRTYFTWAHVRAHTHTHGCDPPTGLPTSCPKTHLQSFVSAWHSWYSFTFCQFTGAVSTSKLSGFCNLMAFMQHLEASATLRQQS